MKMDLMGTFMTFTMYVFGLGFGIWAIRNEDKVIAGVTGLYNAGVGVVKGVGSI